MYKEDQIITLARKAWAHFYGPCRAIRAAKRADYGTKRPRASGETAWIRERRRRVHEISETTQIDAGIPDRAHGWGATHEKEELFVNTKKMKRMCEIASEGHFLPSEQTQEIKDSMKVMNRKRHENAIVRRQNERIRLAADRVDVPDFSKMAAWVHPGRVVTTDLRRHVGCICATRETAAVLVVTDITAAGIRTRWSAALGGGYIASLEFVISQGSEGTCTKLRTAVSTPRVLWVSPRFVANHPKLYAIIRAKISDRNSKWILFTPQELDGFMNRIDRLKTKKGKPGPQTVALVCINEIQKFPEDRF